MAYTIELFAREPITPDHDSLRAAMNTMFPNVEAPEPKAPGGTQLFLLHDHTVSYEQGSVPAQLVVLPANAGPELEKYADAFLQCWSFPQAQDIVAACKFSCLFSDVMSAALPQKERRQILAKGLLALLQTQPVDAVYFPESQTFADPTRLMAALRKQEANPSTGFVNVRFYQVSNTPGDMVMDTLGMESFGLTDLQIHFRDLEPNDVGRVMRRTAAYLLDRGNVITTGHTIQGRSEGEQWTCQQENSLLEPRRTVLDINPGDPFAAGRRAA